jgi:hypothetical protein
MSTGGREGYPLVSTPGGDQLRARLRQALRRFIDPDDDTMPALNGIASGGFTWVGVDSVLDELIEAVNQPKRYPILTHAYEGEGFLHPCTAIGHGLMCGDTQYDHEEQR